VQFSVPLADAAVAVIEYTAEGKETGKRTVDPVDENVLNPHCIINPPGSVMYPLLVRDCAPRGWE